MFSLFGRTRHHVITSPAASIQIALETKSHNRDTNRGIVTLANDVVTTAALDVVFESLSQVADAVRVHCLMVERPRMIYIAGNPAGLF